MSNLESKEDSLGYPVLSPTGLRDFEISTKRDIDRYARRLHHIKKAWYGEVESQLGDGEVEGGTYGGGECT